MLQVKVELYNDNFQNYKKYNIMEEMRQAIQELRTAENLFNNAMNDKETDIAIYKINAARLKIDLISEYAKKVS